MVFLNIFFQGIQTSVADINKYVKVFKMTKNIKFADIVHLVVLNGPKMMEINSELCNRISKSYTDSILTIGNEISIMFYGRIIKLILKAIHTSGSECLEIKLEKMDIEEQFYKINEKTKWKLYRYEWYRFYK